MSITVTPATPGFFAEISDIDLAQPLQPADRDAIEDAINRYAVVVFRGQKLSDAEVDYESFNGLHNFLIRHDGTRFRVQFTDQALLRKSAYEIEEAIHKVVERVLCATSSRLFKTAA